MNLDKYQGQSSVKAVLERCRDGFVNVSGRDLVFSRDFTHEEFRRRRQTLAGQVGPDAHVLIAGAPSQPGLHASQDATFYYFTGLDVLQAYVLIDGKDGTSTLFLPTRDDMDADQNDRVGFEDADLVRRRLRVDAVKPLDQMADDLLTVSKLYLHFSEPEGGAVTRFLANGNAKHRARQEWDGAEPNHERLIRKLKAQFPSIVIEDASAMIGLMRRIKSEAEIELLRQAGHLSALATMEAMKATHPGMCESQLEAITRYVYAAYGNCDLGYGVIGASGDRIENGHYHYNNAIMNDGEVVLMDCGPDLRHYSSDMARIWPVSGTYSDWHRKVYGCVVEYHKVLISLIKPGARAVDLYAEAGEMMLHGCKHGTLPCGDMSDVVQKMIDKGTKYYNHSVGLSTHDFVGPWRDCAFEEGMVFVVDPMIMFRDRHQYIRCEDTIVVTSDGCERLTGAAPLELDEVEAFMKQPSNLFANPDSLWDVL